MNIDELPKGWIRCSLIDCGEITSGGTPSTKIAANWGDEVSWITPADLSGYENKHIAKGKKSITQKGLLRSSAKLMPAGSVLFSTRAPIGYVAIATNELCTNQGFKSITPDGHLHNEFLYYFLKSAKQLAEEHASGTTFRELSLTAFSQLTIDVPPLPEQHRIVAKIEELFSELDKGVEALKTAQQQLKIYRQAVLKWAFEGKLTNKNVVEGELPEGWKWVKIDFFLSDKRRGITTGPFGTMLKKSEHQNSGVPVLGIENIGEGMFQMPNKIFITTLKAQELNNFAVSANDIIISRSGTVGEICAVPANMRGSIISTNLIKVSINQEVLDDKYFVYLFQGGKVRQQVFDLCKGSSRAFLNQTILTSLDFPYCPLPEQRAIVSEIESRLSVADKIEESISQSMKQAEALRQSILKKAFAGKLVPQDPNDEPAEKLLERIRAERAALAPMMVTMKRKGAGRKAAEQGVAQRAVRRANKKGV